MTDNRPPRRHADTHYDSMSSTKHEGSGAWRSGGRPKVTSNEKLSPASLRLTQPQIEKLNRLGGAAWVRARIDSAERAGKGSDDRAMGRIHSDDPEIALRLKTVRLTPAQKVKLARMGGAAWLRRRIERARGSDAESKDPLA